jgi:hypothetical protein
MARRFEYKFVRLGQKPKDWFWGTRTAGDEVASYQQAIHEHAGEGWRLVQIFAPPTAAEGSAEYFELIFERVVAEAEG